MASLINKYIGHKEQKNLLLRLIQNDEFPSSYIFHGPEGLGKKTLVHALLQVFNCEKSESSCGECSNCLRALEEKNEMYFELKPETKKIISVSQIRELHSYLSLKPLQKARFIIIDPADKLSTQASNALLKVLEESPPKTYFFLITDRIFSLLATIRSRSQIMHFQKLSEEELNQAGTFDAVAIEWSDGRINLAEQFMQEDSIELLNKSLKFLYSITCESAQDWKKAAPWFFTNDDHRNFGLNIWSQALEKRLYGKGSNLNWLPQKPQDLSKLFEQIEDLKKDFNANVDKLLAIENFHYQIKDKLSY
jgi:DNA polymerase III gamma/tau subunit